MTIAVIYATFAVAKRKSEKNIGNNAATMLQRFVELKIVVVNLLV